MESRVIIFSIEQMFESSGKYPSTWKNDMNSAQLHNDQNNDDEIDLAQIIRDIAKEKKRFLKNGAKVLGVWLILFIIYGLITFNPSTYYSEVLGVNFPQAAQGKYPNGSPFSASDIVSNTVLEKVWTDNKLADRGIKLQTFQNSVSAIPYSGEMEFINTKYKNLLAQKNLSRTDIEKLEADYKAEIDQAASKNIKLILDTRGENYDTVLAAKVLNDVASAWSKAAIEKLGVSRAPSLDGVVLDDSMKTASPYLVLNYLNDLIYKAQSVVLTMQADTNSNSYRDSQTGLNLSGAFTKLNQISNYQIDQLDAFVAIHIKPSDEERLQTRYKLLDLEDLRSQLMQKAESNRRALADYTNSSNQNNAASQSKGRANNSGDSSVQINGDAITKLFSLATESKDAEYRQQLTSNRIALEAQAASLSSQIIKLQRRINFSDSKATTMNAESKKQYDALLGSVWTNLSDVIGVITRIQVAAQKDFVGDSGLLYTVVTQPVASHPGRSALIKSALMSLILFVFLSLALSLFQIFSAKLLNKEQVAKWRWARGWVIWLMPGIGH